MPKDDQFESFVQQAQAILGSDVSRSWLTDVWAGADGDLNRALNHALDTPSDKVKRDSNRESAGDKSRKTDSKKRTKDSKPAKPIEVPAAWLDENTHSQTGRTSVEQPRPPMSQPAPMVHQQPAPMSGPPGSGPLGYPQAPAFGTQPVGMTMTQQPAYGFAPQQGYMQPPTQMFGPPQALAPQPATGFDAELMFVGQVQHNRLCQLKGALDSVIANPELIRNPQAMQNLQDHMLLALEAPAATLTLADRARQTQQTGALISQVEAHISKMLSDVNVATNPVLLSQVSNQMNSLRAIMSEHNSQRQLDAHPATALSLTMPLITKASPSASMLNQVQSLNSNFALLDKTPPPGDDDEWWLDKNVSSSRDLRLNGSARTLASTNPFGEQGDSRTGNSPTVRQLAHSMPRLEGYNSDPYGGLSPMQSALERARAGYQGYSFR